MSGGKLTSFADFVILLSFRLVSIAFVAFGSGRFWCETGAVPDTSVAGQRDIDRANCTVGSNPTLSARTMVRGIPFNPKL